MGSIPSQVLRFFFLFSRKKISGLVCCGLTSMDVCDFNQMLNFKSVAVPL